MPGLFQVSGNGQKSGQGIKSFSYLKSWKQQSLTQGYNPGYSVRQDLTCSGLVSRESMNTNTEKPTRVMCVKKPKQLEADWDEPSRKLLIRDKSLCLVNTLEMMGQYLRKESHCNYTYMLLVSHFVYLCFHEIPNMHLSWVISGVSLLHFKDLPCCLFSR